MTHKPVHKYLLVLKRWKDALTINPKYVYPLLAFQWGCGSVDKPRLSSAWVRFGRSDKDNSLYHNGLLFLRLTWPLGFFFHIRWSGKPTAKRQYLQLGLGYKINGQLAHTFRLSGDEASADGVYGPNYGQAQGWDCGSH